MKRLIIVHAFQMECFLRACCARFQCEGKAKQNRAAWFILILRVIKCFVLTQKCALDLHAEYRGWTVDIVEVGWDGETRSDRALNCACCY